MFSSSSSMNLFPNLSSSYNLHFSPAFAGYDSNNTFLDHQQDPLTGLLLPANTRLIESLTNMAFTGNNATMIKQQDFDRLNGDYYGPLNFISSQKSVRKDRHSKICTAQGYRDRRVRLSIEIAREFFDLQDMLGFDKPSKTLEWLLNKSREAIKELAELKQMGNDCANKSFYPVCHHEVVCANGDLEDNGSRCKPFEAISEEKSMEKLCRTALQLLAKESRDKARARARKRTREKISTRRFQDCKKVRANSSPQILTQVSSLSQFKAWEEASSYPHNISSSLNVGAHEATEPCSHELANQASMEVVDEQGSNVLERKQNRSSIFAYQQNLEISKDISSNISNYNFNLPQNWDTNSAMAPQSTFCAITNMNLSNGLQFHGKTCWEPRNSSCQQWS